MTAHGRINTEERWTTLRDSIRRATASHTGTHETRIKGFAFHRFVDAQAPTPHMHQPVIIVVAQGKKVVRIGDAAYCYGENVCFVAGVDMPVVSCAIECSEQKPYLSLSLNLDPGLIADLASRVPPASQAGVGVSVGAVLHELDPDLLDALVRLAELHEKPEHLPVMEALLRQEVHYRLLAGPFGNALRALTTFGSQSHQITRAIVWLKAHYKEHFPMESLAAQSNMALSTFHKYFKELTTVSPLQYQKRLRLTEAQRLMLAEGHDVTRAAMAVGYESATQFIREYKRLFGDPPRRNVMSVKAGPGAPARRAAM